MKGLEKSFLRIINSCKGCIVFNFAKFILLPLFLFLTSIPSFSEEKVEVRQRDIDVITSYYFKERSEELTFSKETWVVETFTVINDKDVGFSYVIMLPDVFKDKKNWKVSAMMMTLTKDSIVRRHDFKANVTTLTDIETGNKFTGLNMFFWTPGSQQNTFYYKFEYIGKEKEIKVPWNFELLIAKELKENKAINNFYGKPIKYVININEFR